ncbi:MAG: SEC-C metal-binding domain-containing protein [Longimicrobiales bacterium]|nr:SEC-C metal-binding domain-containing protein [Longimicrobiales bacterium]
MTAHRNDPCPCGSGRKHKHCCMERDQRQATSSGPAQHVRTAAAAAGYWEADLLPFPGVPGDRPGVSVVMSLVMADGFALRSDVFDHPGSEPAEVASALAEQIHATMRTVGASPARVRVGDEEVAALLAPLLLQDGVGSVESGPLPQVAAAGRALFEHLNGEGSWPSGAVRETWRGWGRPGAEVAALFRAAAAFHRATPWKVVTSEQPVAAWMPGGRKWAMAVMGSGGEEFGLALYSQVSDYIAVLEHDPSEVWERQEGRVYGLVLGRRGDLPRAMQKEVAAAGWDVASPSAYPILVSLRSPAGGICRHDWADLVALLDALPRFLTHGLGFSGRDAAAVDPVSGISFILLPDVNANVPAPPLTLGGAEGPGAEPEAALLLDPDEASLGDPTLLEDFGDWLDASGLAESTVQKHMTNVVSFLFYLEDTEGVPVRAIHEYDLRSFFFDWIHRKTAAGRGRIESTPASLRKFVTFLREDRGIHLPWARGVLDDQEFYRARARSCPREPFWSRRTRKWLEELTLDFFLRGFLPDDAMGEDDEWGDTMGDVEWKLHAELQRRWLLWREELIRAGVSEHRAVLTELCRRQRAWETAPNPGGDGRTPIEAIRAERQELAVD